MVGTVTEYTADWAGDAGLDLEPGFCVSFVRGVEPRQALRRFGVPDGVVRTGQWADIDAHAGSLSQYDHIPVAALALGPVTLVVERNGYRGSLPECAGPLSAGTEVLNVHLNPASGLMTLTAFRDGTHLLSVDTDDPDVITVHDSRAEDIAARLPDLVWGAFTPWDGSEESPDSLEDGDVDLLQVACDHLGIRPGLDDVRRPVVGAAMSLLPPTPDRPEFA